MLTVYLFMLSFPHWQQRSALCAFLLLSRFEPKCHADVESWLRYFKPSSRKSAIIPNVYFLPNTAYYVSFGPHGPREPVSKEGDGLKTVLGVVGLLGVSGLIFAGIRSMGMYLYLEATYYYRGP